MGRSRWAAMVVAACVGAALTQTAEGGPNAYDRMDSRKLAEQLSAMGMFELLEAYASELPDPDAAKYLLARGKITRATTSNLPLEQRDRLLGEAIAILKQLSARTDRMKGDKGLLERYRITLELIEAAGLMRSKPYALRLMYLQGGKADRETLIDITGTVVSQLDRLDRDLEFTMEEWRSDLKKLATVFPELESFREAVRYKRAWIQFYRGMAMGTGPGRTRLLGDALAAAEKFASGEQSSGVVYWSRLLVGMCARELKGYNRADQELKKADTDPAASAVRIQALFEIARNLIEAGNFEDAARAIDQFRTRGMGLLGPGGELEIDVKSTMLRSFFHEVRAAAERDPDASAKHLAAAQQPPLEFLAKYSDRPAVKAAFLEVLATKYRDRKDYGNLNSVILLAIATYEGARAPDDPQGKSERLLRSILAREDPVSRSLKPDAIWELGRRMNARRMNLEAGRWFVRIPREFPVHRLAMQSAKNAAYSYSGVIEGLRRSRTLIPPDLRREFIKVLETLLSRWAHRDDVGKWYFDLGWEYQQLAGKGNHELMSKAVEAYDLVPGDLPESMEGRYLGLALREALLDGPPETRGDPAALAEMLDAYAAAAKAAAGLAEDPASARRVRERGAMSAFRAVRIRYERLGREEEALERLRELPDEWADTEVLPAIWEFEIGKLVERNETSRAIGKVDAFGKKYPAKVQGLMRLVVGQVRRRIEDLRGDPDRTEDLRNYKLVFDRFAEELYRNAAAKNLPAAKMYPIEQMRAESLLAGGKPAAALELFEKCADYDAKLRSAKAKQIDEEIARWIERTERARGGVTAIDMLSREYFDLLGKHGYDVEDFGEAVSVRTAVEFLREATVSEQQRERSAVVIDELLAALGALERALKRDLPMDAGNVRGLARAHRAMKNYKGGGALKYYSELVEGIDRSRYSALYWSVQLERCQCLLEAFRTDKEQLKRLSVLIRQLRLEDPAMGGLYDRFNALELRVLRLKR